MADENEYGNKGEVEQMIDMLNKTASKAAQVAAGVYFRKMLASRHSPPLHLVLASGRLIPALISCLNRTTIPELQLDAAWAITNIACGSQRETHQVVDQGGVHALLQLAQTCADGELRDQAVWGLGNIAADCFGCKTLLRDAGLFEAIAFLLTTYVRQSADRRHHYVDPLRTAIWCLANLCRGGIHTVDLNLIRTVVQIMAEVLLSPDFADDAELLADACWVVAYIANDTAAGLQVVLDEERLVPQMVANLSKTCERRVLSGSLRTIGNLITGDDEQTFSVLSHDVLPHLLRLLQNGWGHIRREAAWTISNVAAGPPEHIELLFALDDMLGALLDAIYNGEAKVRKEAGWTLANALTGGEQRRVVWLSMRGAVPALCTLVDKDADRRLVECSLRALDAVLKTDPTFATMVRRCGGLAVVQRLMLQTADGVLEEKARKLVDDFFPRLGPKQADVSYCFVRN